jgi:hypothetical protein
MAASRPGRAHFICDRLYQLDERHGQHAAGTRHPDLVDPEGHTALTLVWGEGGSIPASHPGLKCACGRPLRWLDLDDPREVIEVGD